MPCKAGVYSRTDDRAGTKRFSARLEQPLLVPGTGRPARPILRPYTYTHSSTPVSRHRVRLVRLRVLITGGAPIYAVEYVTRVFLCYSCCIRARTGQERCSERPFADFAATDSVREHNSINSTVIGGPTSLGLELRQAGAVHPSADCGCGALTVHPVLQLMKQVVSPHAAACLRAEGHAVANQRRHTHGERGAARKQLPNGPGAGPVAPGDLSGASWKQRPSKPCPHSHKLALQDGAPLHESICDVASTTTKRHSRGPSRLPRASAIGHQNRHQTTSKPRQITSDHIMVGSRSPFRV